VAILCQAFIPGSASKLLDLLSVAPGNRQFTCLGEEGALVPGTALPAPQGVFPRYVEAEPAK
jgi:methionyl-tRNA synthetase